MSDVLLGALWIKSSAYLGRGRGGRGKEGMGVTKLFGSAGRAVGLPRGKAAHYRHGPHVPASTDCL